MDKDKKIGFIGQGWIGKNYSDNFEQRGYEVIRYAKEEPYNKNQDAIKNCDIVFIAVPTPSTPEGFDDSIIRSVVKLVGHNKTAVIKSTLYPGVAELIQKENPDIYVLYSPEFLAEATAAYDASNPTRNIIGIPIDNFEYRQRAKEALEVLPYAPYQSVCSYAEAALIKYGGNNFFYFKVVFINMLYDLSKILGARWEVVREGIANDPRIGHSHMEPIHKTGRGAGGHCFIKDFAAFHSAYNDLVGDGEGAKVLDAMRDKNLDLLISSSKDLDLISGIYGKDAINNPPAKKILNKNISSQPAANKRPPRCLVTGGAGFIGSNLVDELIKLGCEVRIIDNLLTGKREYLNPQAKFYELDIRDLEAIKPVFENIDYVFHLAAYPRVQLSIDNPVLAHDINLNGTLNVLLAAHNAKVKKVVYSASSAAYGNQAQMPLKENMPTNPLSPYAMQKYMGEGYCRLFSEIYGLPTVALRYFNIYGKRQAMEGAYALVTALFIRQRLEGQPLTITGDGEQKRDFTSVIDVVRANILAAKSDKVGRGEVMNIGRGRNYSVNELAALVGGPVVYVPPRIEPKETLADNNLAKELIGWEPTVDFPDWLIEHKKEMGLN